jgi:hypothetical protein
MEYLNNLLINTILDIMNQIKSQISSSVVHLSPGLAGIGPPHYTSLQQSDNLIDYIRTYWKVYISEIFTGLHCILTNNLVI